MQILPYIYLGYMFLALYLISFFLLIYLRNRKQMFDYPVSRKKYTISFLVPAYNEEKTIADTIKHIFAIDYDILEVIVINDGSKDRTAEIVKQLQGKYPRLKLLNKKNSGKADSLNQGIKIAKGELVAVTDADSYPASDSIRKMTGFFDDASVGVVTCPVIARNRNIFIEKLQAIEYKVIAFTRKLLDYVDAIYATPGPLALYRKKALIDINGFDKNNMTEDIEATWHLTKNGWQRRMCLSTEVTTTVPSKFLAWFRQRRRWNVGGLQCIYKYRNSVLKGGMLGYFIIPLFVVSTFLGLLGLGIFAYLLIRRGISNFLYVKYSLIASSPVLSMQDFYVTPSVLNYLGIVLFLLSLVFTLLFISKLKEKILTKENILNIPFYMIVYLMFYPFIMAGSIFHMMRGKRVWR